MVGLGKLPFKIAVAATAFAALAPAAGARAAAPAPTTKTIVAAIGADGALTMKTTSGTLVSSVKAGFYFLIVVDESKTQGIMITGSRVTLSTPRQGDVGGHVQGPALQGAVQVLDLPARQAGSRPQGHLSPKPDRGRARPRAVQPAPAPRKARPRKLIAGLAILVALGLVVGLGDALTRSSSKHPIPPDALPGTSDVEQLLSGIPQSDNVLGSPSAPVQVIEYLDLQCPYCKDAEAHAVNVVISRYVRTGKASLELRLLDSIGRDSVRGRDAALAAGRQNKLFDLVELLYLQQQAENSGWLSDSLVRAAAKSIPGVDVDQLVADMSSQAVADEAQAMLRQQQEQAVNETPTFFVGPRDGSLQHVTLSSSEDETTLPAAIDAAR